MKKAVLISIFCCMVGLYIASAQVSCTTTPAWSANTTYPTLGIQVTYNNNLYQSKWWTQNQQPSPTDASGPWQFLGNCQVGTSGPAPTTFSVSGWANNGTAIYTINSGNVGIGNPNPTQKLDVFGNIQITGAGNALRFADGTLLNSATAAGLWVAKGDTAIYTKAVNIGGVLKIGKNSLYGYSYPNPNGTGSINEFYADNGPLIIQNTNPSLRVLIGTMDNTNLAGLNSYSQNSKVLANGHISLLGWDNVANTTVDNWFRTDRLVMQNIQDQDANHWHRGLVTNNLIWDSGTNTYSVLNNTQGQNDFAGIRFDNFGNLGFYTAPQNGNYASLQPSQLESYNRLYISNTGKVGVGTNQPFADFHVNKAIDPLFAVSAPVNGGTASGRIAVASNNASYNSIATPGDVIINAACGTTEDLILAVANSMNGAIRFTTNGGYGCGTAPDLERMTIIGNGNVGIGRSTPTARLHVGGNALVEGDLKVTGKVNFADDTYFTMNSNYLTYNGGLNVTNTLKVGTGSLILNGGNTSPITGVASRNQIYAANGDLYIQDQANAGNTIINPTSGKFLIGINEYSDLGGGSFGISKVYVDGHISLRGWDNSINQPVNNFFRSDRIVMQNIQDGTASHWHRGMVANNLIWETTKDAYYFQNTNGNQDDFAALRFDDGGAISLIAGPKGFSSQTGIGAGTLESTYTRLKITETGNVGIGTIFPVSNLHVVGNQNGEVGITKVLFGGQNSGNTYLEMGTSAASNGYSFIRSAKGHNISWGDLVLNENGGNVGIGQTNPTATLDINSGSDPLATSVKVTGRFKSDNIHGGMWCGSGAFVGLNGSDKVGFFNGSYWRLLVDNSGNVGIGTDVVVPSGYKLAVDGAIICKDKVKVCNVSGWCDYVFDSKYELMPIQNLKEYIKSNNHLPEIPSTSQVQKEGVELLEMNKLLLKKVEELTLYIIAQEERILKLELIVK